MNITHVMDQITVVPSPTPEAWKELLQRRWETAQGFGEVERMNGGLVVPPVDLSTKMGQEVARLVFFRAIEEFYEAVDAEDTAHVLEELIDSVNYLLTALLIDLNVQKKPLEKILFEDGPGSFGLHSRPSIKHLGAVASLLSEVTDSFRNRAWMNRSQDIYFAGEEVFIESIIHCVYICMSFFQNWEEFWKFFVAKDEVLKFRLRTGY